MLIVGLTITILDADGLANIPNREGRHKSVQEGDRNKEQTVQVAHGERRRKRSPVSPALKIVIATKTAGADTRNDIENA